jgi:hypothetical protein
LLPELPQTPKRKLFVPEVMAVQVLPSKRRMVITPTAKISLPELPQTPVRPRVVPEVMAAQVLPS